MSSSVLSTKRVSTRRLLIGALVVCALLALVFAATPSEAANPIDVADPAVQASEPAQEAVPKAASASVSAYEAQLSKMTDEQLKKMLLDRSQNKKIDWKKYATREAVMEALVAEDREEARRKGFLQREAAALAKQAQHPLRDDSHTVNIVYCSHTSYEPDVHRYEEALVEKVAIAARTAELEKKAKKEKKQTDGAEKPPVVTFTALERSFFLPNADRIKFSSEPYPLPKSHQLKSQIFTTLFGITIGLSFMVGQLTFIPDRIRNYLVQHRTLLVSTAMMFNLFGSTSKRTGAFEVYVDGSLVYSHIQHGGTGAPLPSITFMSELLIEKTLLIPYGV